MDADILLLDEILSVADVSFREKYSKNLEEISKEQKKTILFVSHNHDLLSQSCDCGILVWEGTAKFYENFSECLTAYNQKIEGVKSTVTNMPIKFRKQTVDYEIINIECNDFEAFKPFSLDIKYNVIKAGENLSFGLAMMNRNQKGFSLSIDPGSTGNTLSAEIGSFQMTVNYPYLPCHPGEYELYISFWNGSFLEEVSTHKLLINVKGNQLLGSGQKTGFQVCPTDFENYRL